MCRAENICDHLGFPGQIFYTKEDSRYFPNEDVTLAYTVLKASGITSEQIKASRYLEMVAARTGRWGRLIKMHNIAHPKSKLNDSQDNKVYNHNQ